jgi:hypothetical protein
MNDYLLRVCSECLTSRCINGILLCQGHNDNDGVLVSYTELLRLNKEPPKYLTKAFLKKYGLEQIKVSVEDVYAISNNRKNKTTNRYTGR